MIEAQSIFDQLVAPACPTELAAPKLHSVLGYPPLQELIWGGKGVGSQGDGTLRVRPSGSLVPYGGKPLRVRGVLQEGNPPAAPRSPPSLRQRQGRTGLVSPLGQGKRSFIFFLSFNDFGSGLCQQGAVGGWVKSKCHFSTGLYRIRSELRCILQRLSGQDKQYLRLKVAI